MKLKVYFVQARKPQKNVILLSYPVGGKLSAQILGFDPCRNLLLADGSSCETQ
jgi:hypothetical protein